MKICPPCLSWIFKIYLEIFSEAVDDWAGDSKEFVVVFPAHVVGGSSWTKRVLFYLGGSSDVTLRFHVVRDACANWVDLSDKAFRKKEKLKIVRLTEEGLFEEK